MPTSSELRPEDANEDLSGFYAAVQSEGETLFLPEPDHADAEAYFRSLLPLCRAAQITRIADVTGLDRLGLPIVQAVRPLALSEVTSLGRGTSRTSAAIGAIMEALERFYAESISGSRLFISTAEKLAVKAASFDGLCSPDCLVNWREREIAWIMAMDMETGVAAPVPFELVHTIYTDPPPSSDGVFLRSTTGLACHRTRGASFAHGLLECIERDAMARAFRSHGFMDRMRMPATGLGPVVHDILARVAKSGIAAAFWYAPSPVGVPVVWCQTIETGENEAMLILPTEGYCAGLDLRQAALGALLEALAARAGAISGARDDQTRKHYARPNETILAQARDMILGDFAPLSADLLDALPPVADLADLVQRATSAGLGPVLAVPISSRREPDVHCVRTILAGMQSFAIGR